MATMTAVSAAADMAMIQGMGQTTEVSSKGSCSWQKGLLMVSIASSVAAIALSFFTGAIATLPGHILWAGVSIYALYLSSGALDGRKLQELTSKLNDSDAKILQAEKKATEWQHSCDEQRAFLREADARFQAEVHSLSEEYEGLKARNIALEQIAKDLREQNALTQENSKKLEDKVAAFSSAMGDMGKEMHSFVDEQVQLASKVQLFGHEMTDLSGLHNTFSSTVGQFEDSFEAASTKLTQYMETLRTCSKMLFDGAMQQRSEMKVQIERLSVISFEVSEKTKSLDSKIKVLEEREQDLSAINKQMKDRKEELVILQKQLADIELERSSKIQILSSLEEKIASQNTQLIHNIERAEKQMQDLYEQKARALAAISQQIEIKQKMVIELDKHLKEKIAELDTVPTSYV